MLDVDVSRADLACHILDLTLENLPGPLLLFAGLYTLVPISFRSRPGHCRTTENRSHRFIEVDVASPIS
jgi:hypothetical protein